MTIALATTVADGDREIAGLRAAVDAYLPPHTGDEPTPIILEALAADPTLFRAPTRPLGELLEEAGMERRGNSYGRVSQEWTSFGDRSVAKAHERDVLDRWNFDDCCDDALDIVQRAFVMFGTDEHAVFDAVAVADALAHGAVTPAFAELILGDEPGAEPILAAFAQAVIVDVPPALSTPARLLWAIESIARGDHIGAEPALREGFHADPGYGPTVLWLAQYEIDRGELGRALTLLHHPAVSFRAETTRALERFREEIDAPYRGVGRNDRCPCGSGRKFKLCCLREPKTPLSTRTGLLFFKLLQFGARPEHRPTIIGTASSACDPGVPDLVAAINEKANDPAIFDFALFERGLSEDYLDLRGELLPADERQLLRRLIDQPRQLCEVIAVDRGISATVRVTDENQDLTVELRAADSPRSLGELLLARIARLDEVNQFFGEPITVPADRRDDLVAVLANHPDADALARWYGKHDIVSNTVN